MHNGLVFWLHLVFIGCLHGRLCCFVGLGRCVVDLLLSDSVSDVVGSLYAESVLSVLLFRFCIILLGCFVDFFLSLGVNAGLVKRCLVAIMNFAIFI